MSAITPELVLAQLRQVLDPETHVNIVDMGFIRDVRVIPPEDSQDNRKKVSITYTLTTPGCPLAGTIQLSIKNALTHFSELDPDQDIYTELSFDPPWSLQDMSDEARAELGFST